MKPFFFREPLLPDGFNFPREYEELVINNSLPDINPWHFLALDMPNSLYYYGSMLSKFKSPLIPFAMINDQTGYFNDGWVVLACFDGLDKSGHPLIRIYDYSQPKISPWDSSSFQDFSEWLSVAKETSKTFKDEYDEAERKEEH